MDPAFTTSVGISLLEIALWGGLVSFILGFIPAVFVAEDALRDERAHPVRWGVFAFFFGYLGLAIYYLTKHRNEEWHRTLTASRVRWLTIKWAIIWILIGTLFVIGVVALFYLLLYSLMVH